MESSMNDGNESDYDMGYRERGSLDNGLDLDMELRGPEDEQAVHVNAVGGELAGLDLDHDTEPYEGMEFEAEDQAWTFYCAYANRLGFTVRVNNYHRSRQDGSITTREFVCAKEGFRKTRGRKDASSDGKTKRLRGITKVECKAMIRVRKQENGKWVVSKIQKVHNHSMASQTSSHCLPPDSVPPPSTRGTMGTFRGVVLDQSIDCMPLCSDEPQQALHFGYISDDHISYTGVGRPGTIGRETQSILEYLKHMQAEDPEFFYALHFDDDQCTGNVFWADAKSRMAYKYFGDSVIFDTSYKTNQYQIPLAIFSGVNHHQQPVLFGCSILVDDSLPSLVWLFKTLLSAMSDRHPVSLITDHNQDLQVAVAHVFPESRHRLCKWHILMERQDKLSNVYHSYPSFGGEFHKCINQTETVDEFESCWWGLVSRYNLRDNKWIQAIYDLRHQWVPVFLRNSFFAEVSSAQRCESRSIFFEGHVSAQTPPHAFVQQYEKALDSRYEKEIKADFDTIYSLPHLKTPSPMEKQAAESYTRKIFMKFQEEFIQTFAYTASKTKDEGSISTFKVAKFEEEHKAFIVVFNSAETTATCSCQLFENSGILCRHILTVFSVTSVITLPPDYILKRWTRNAKKDDAFETKDELPFDEANAEAQNKDENSRECLTWRYNSLCREAIKYAEDGATSIDIYNVAIRALQEAVKKVAIAKANMGKSGQAGASVNGSTLGNQLDNMKEKHLQGLHVEVAEQATTSQVSNVEGHIVAPSNIVQLAPGQEDRHMLLQQPFNLVLFAPGLTGDSGTPNMSSLSSVTFNAHNALSQLHTPTLPCNQGTNVPIPFMVQNQFLCAPGSAGGLDGMGQVMISLPGGNAQEGDLRHGSAALSAQIYNLGAMAQANNNLVSGANSVGSSAPSEPQLVAVPMAFYIPAIDVPIASSASIISNASGSSSGVHSSLATLPVTLLPQDAVPHSPLVAPFVPTVSTNLAHAAANSSGVPQASPSTIMTSIKATKARNVAHRRSRRGSSSESTMEGGYKTLVPRTWVPQPQNAHLYLVGRNPKPLCSAAIISDMPQIGSQQKQVHCSKQPSSLKVVMAEDTGHTGKVPAQAPVGVTGGMATLTAEVLPLKEAEKAPDG